MIVKMTSYWLCTSVQVNWATIQKNHYNFYSFKDVHKIYSLGSGTVGFPAQLTFSSAIWQRNPKDSPSAISIKHMLPKFISSTHIWLLFQRICVFPGDCGISFIKERRGSLLTGKIRSVENHGWSNLAPRWVGSFKYVFRPSFKWHVGLQVKNSLGGMVHKLNAVLNPNWTKINGCNTSMSSNQF